jgi:hypothetical protein
MTEFYKEILFLRKSSIDENLSCEAIYGIMSYSRFDVFLKSTIATVLLNNQIVHTLCTVDKSQKSLFRIENGSKLLLIKPFDIALFLTSIIDRRIISRRSLNGFFPTFSF